MIEKLKNSEWVKWIRFIVAFTVIIVPLILFCYLEVVFYRIFRIFKSCNKFITWVGMMICPKRSIPKWFEEWFENYSKKQKEPGNREGELYE